MKQRSDLNLKLEDLFSIGAQFGHKILHPKMKPYVYCIMNDIFIINLEKTIEKINKVCDLMFNLGKNGEKILFVGTKPVSKELVKDTASKLGCFYVTSKWNAGLLTNIQTTLNTIANINKMMIMKDNINLTKKYRNKIERTVNKQKIIYEGVLNMKKLPSAIICLSAGEKKAIIEAGKHLNIPVVSIIDTNDSTDHIQYPIPCNDDVEAVIKTILDTIKHYYLEGLENYVGKKHFH